MSALLFSSGWKRHIVANLLLCMEETFTATHRFPSVLVPKDGRFAPSFDPHTYTAGRWLHRDEERRRARRVAFDFDALMSNVVDCSPTASRVVDCKKLEGGFNRVFMVTLDNGEELVARIPTRHAGQPSLSMAFEVSTLKYVALSTDLPVPKVLRWAGSKDNSVCTEYMITTRLPGIPLRDLWPKLSSYQHLCCIESLNVVLRKLTRLSFPAYGSLYLSSMLPEKFPRVPLPNEDAFCVGPHSGASFWVSQAHSESSQVVQPALGPFKDFSSYAEDLFKAGYEHARQSRAEQESKRQPYQGSREEVEYLLGNSQAVMEQMLQYPLINDLSTATFMHPDFNLRNVLVDPGDPTSITGLIDWQSASIEPAVVWPADRPDFAQQMPNDPEMDTIEIKSQARQEHEKDMSLCSQAWSAFLLADPKISPAAQVDPLLCQFLASPHSIWNDGTANHIWKLTEISNQWHELGFSGNGAFQPLDIDQQKQKVDFENSESSERLRSHLCRVLGCESDGWVPADRWDDTLEQYRDIYAKWRQSLEDDQETSSPEVTDSLLWPFDHIWRR